MQETDVVRRCQEGDIDAYRWLYDRYHQALLHTALRILGQQQDAEDAVQTAFIKLYKGVHGFKHQSKFSTYLFRILMNVCFDQLEKRKRMSGKSMDNIDIPEKPMQELRVQLDQAIDLLPEQQKACFVLFAMEGLKQDEISEIMGLSLGGVKSNIFHAKRKLRELLVDAR